MKTYSKLLAITLLGMAFVACSDSDSSSQTQGASSEQGAMLKDSEIGLRKVELENEKDVKLPSYEYSKSEAGESQKIERSYENAPPMIPHSIEDMLPITQDNNMCLTCHDPAVAADVGAVAVPSSHTYDLRAEKKLDEVANARFNCVLCHTPQANLAPAVGNTFTPAFRQESGKSQSNLLDVLNEGVK